MMFNNLFINVRAIFQTPLLTVPPAKPQIRFKEKIPCKDRNENPKQSI